MRHEFDDVRDHTPSSAWVNVRGGGCVVDSRGVEVVVEEEDDEVVSGALVVGSSVLELELDVPSDVVGRLGVEDEAELAQPASAARDAQRPTTAGRRST